MVPFVLFDIMTLLGYLWPYRELFRMAKDRNYASPLRVAITCFSMVTVAVAVLASVIVIWNQ